MINTPAGKRYKMLRTTALAAAREAATLTSGSAPWPLTVSVPLPAGLDFEDECLYEDTFVAEFNRLCARAGDSP
jgi:hypothetical protein